MNKKLGITLLGILIVSAMLFAYFMVRPGMIEKEHAKRVESFTQNIAWLLDGFEREKPLAVRDLRKFRQAIDSRLGPVPFLAITDAGGRILNRDGIDQSNELYYSLAQSIENGQLSRQPGVAVRFHEQKRHYIIIKNAAGGSVITVFPFTITRKTYLKLSLEIALAVLVSVLITTLIYIVFHKGKKPLIKTEFHVTDVSKTAAPSVANEEKASRELHNFATETLSQYVFDLFKFINTSYSPDIIALYVSRPDAGAMSKAYEMKGRSFIRIESPDFDTIDLHNEVGRELTGGSSLVLENGKKILLPVMLRNSLMGTVIIKRDMPFKGPDLGEIKSRFGEIARSLSEYIFFNDVAVEKDTGLYSPVYFNLKLREASSAHASTGAPYAVALLSLTRDESRAGDLPVIIRGVTARLGTILREGDVACRMGDTIALLMANATIEESREICGQIVDTLKKMKIRAGGNVTLDVFPRIGLASSQQDDAHDVLESARKNIEFALSMEEPVVLDNRFRTI